MLSTDVPILNVEKGQCCFPTKSTQVYQKDCLMCKTILIDTTCLLNGQSGKNSAAFTNWKSRRYLQAENVMQGGGIQYYLEGIPKARETVVHAEMCIVISHERTE